MIASECRGPVHSSCGLYNSGGEIRGFECARHAEQESVGSDVQRFFPGHADSASGCKFVSNFLWGAIEFGNEVSDSSKTGSSLVFSMLRSLCT